MVQSCFLKIIYLLFITIGRKKTSSDYCLRRGVDNCKWKGILSLFYGAQLVPPNFSHQVSFSRSQFSLARLSFFRHDSFFWHDFFFSARHFYFGTTFFFGTTLFFLVRLFFFGTTVSFGTTVFFWHDFFFGTSFVFGTTRGRYFIYD